MTLFWHGHFATSGQKVRHAYKMWHQNEILRQNGLANFANLTKAISRDPAMMIWLDTVQSKKERPNENFAREVMELFTLGEAATPNLMSKRRHGHGQATESTKTINSDSLPHNLTRD